MHSSAGRLAVAILGTVLFLHAAVAFAAPPAAPAPAETPEVSAPLCAEESPAPVLDLLDLEPLEQTGQPCCQSLCEQTCGVGEACACKRCVVVGCGV